MDWLDDENPHEYSRNVIPVGNNGIPNTHFRLSLFFLSRALSLSLYIISVLDLFLLRAMDAEAAAAATAEATAVAVVSAAKVAYFTKPGVGDFRYSEIQTTARHPAKCFLFLSNTTGFNISASLSARYSFSVH